MFSNKNSRFTVYILRHMPYLFLVLTVQIDTVTHSPVGGSYDNHTGCGWENKDGSRLTAEVVVYLRVHDEGRWGRCDLRELHERDSAIL